MAGENISQTESVFNPAVPEVKEDTKVQSILNIAKSITTPQSSKATEYGLSGLASVMHEGVQGLYTAKMVGLDEKMRRDINEIKEDRITDLEQQNALLGGAAGAAGTTSRQLTPEAVQSLKRNFEILKDARANGKISNTAFDAKLRAYLSEQRSQNLGFRKEIDEIGHRIIGYDPANKQIESLLADANAMISNRKGENDWVIKQIAEHYPDADWAEDLQRRAQRGENVIVEFTKNKARYDAVKIAAESTKHQDTLDKKTSEVQTDKYVRNVLADGLHNLGISGTKYSYDKIQSDIKEWQRTGFSNRKPEEWRMASFALEQAYSNLHARGMAYGSMPIEVLDGRETTSHIAAQGHTAYEQRVTAALKPLRDVISLINSKENGPAHMVARVTQDIIEGKTYNLVQLDDVANIKASNDISKEFGAWVWTQYQGDPKRTSGMRAVLGVTAAEAGNPGDKDLSASEKVQKMIDAGVTDATTYHDLLRLSEGAFDPTLPKEVRQNIADYFTKPKNQDLISKLKTDSTVTVAGGEKRRIPAAYNGYFILTQPQFTKAVSEMDPQTQTNYRNRAGEWLGKLFQVDINDLNDMGKRIGELHYDTEKHGFPLYSTAGITDSAQYIRVQVANGTINRVNLALKNYAGVIENTGGGDANLEIAKVLETMHFDPSKKNTFQVLYDMLVESLRNTGKTMLRERAKGLSEP